MTGNGLPHDNLAGYVLGSLRPAEEAAFEEHLATCPSCREHVDELGGPAQLLRRAVPDYEIPPELEARTLAAIERAAAEADGAAPARLPTPARNRLFGRRLVMAAAAAAVAAGAVFAGTQLNRPGSGGPLELQAVLAAPGGGAARATVTVRTEGIGRVIAFRTDDLPILPRGEYYELWFVGPGDTPTHPNRISAGTFHPDRQGRSNVDFTAAVDPKLYPILSVTAEPGDGNPQRTGPEVLRSRRDVRAGG